MRMMYPLPWLYPRLLRCAKRRLVKPPNMPLSRGVDTDGVTEVSEWKVDTDGLTRVDGRFLTC